MIEPEVEIQEHDDNEDGFNCRMCMQSFWYQGALNDHLKSKHGISDPFKYEREEKQKKLAILQKQQQLNNAARRIQQPVVSILPRTGLPTRSLTSSSLTRSIASSMAQTRGGEIFRKFGENNGETSLRNMSRTSQLSRDRISDGLVKGVTQLRTKGSASFQYRDGAFVCENCKKRFNDGNVMVKHSCSRRDNNKSRREAITRASKNNKRRINNIKRSKREKDRKKNRNRRGGSVSSIESDSDEIIEETDDDEPDSDKEIVKNQKKIKDDYDRAEKRKGHWTAYLLWSTRKRKELNENFPDYSFTDVSKAISDGWKEITPEETKLLKEEANELNENNVKKLPENNQGSGEEESENSEEEDPTFDETDLKKAVIRATVPVRRSGRTRKNPSFFQELAEKEDKFDELLDHNEEKQMKESIKEEAEGGRKTRARPKVDASEPTASVSSSSSRPARKYRKKAPTPLKDKQPVELETSRSGRVRKKARFNDYFAKDSEEDDDSDNLEDDDFQVKDDEEAPEEESSEEKSESDGDKKEGTDDEEEDAKPLRSLRTKKDRNRNMKKGLQNKLDSRRSEQGKKRVLKVPKRRKDSDASDDNGSCDEDENDDTVNGSDTEKANQENSKDTDTKTSKHAASDVNDDSDEESDTEQDKEAQKHGLTDEKEAMAAMDLPLD